MEFLRSFRPLIVECLIVRDARRDEGDLGCAQGDERTVILLVFNSFEGAADFVASIDQEILRMLRTKRAASVVEQERARELADQFPGVLTGKVLLQCQPG